LIGTQTETGSEFQPLTVRFPRVLPASLRNHASLRARALCRLARLRPLSFSLAFAATAFTAATAGTAAYLHHEQAITLLAPAALTPSAPRFRAAAQPAPPVKKHRFFGGFHGNPLRGLASWYGTVWNGRKTASGETFDSNKLTAAHNSLPLGTLVRVIDLDSRKSVVVKINDRGTLAPNRIIDLSSAAASELGIVQQGLARVKLEILGKS
jgi:rare lipoprotein A